MIVQGGLVVSVEPVPTLLRDQPNALLTVEWNEDGQLVRAEPRRLPRHAETPSDREAHDLALAAHRLLRSLGTAQAALDEARRQGREAALLDFLRQLVALEDIHGEEARRRLASQRRRPGVA